MYTSPVRDARGRPLDGDNAHPFPDFYTYFRHYCAFYVAINSFSVALKFLKGILNTWRGCGDIDVPRWEQNGCATPYTASSIVRIWRRRFNSSPLLLRLLLRPLFFFFAPPLSPGSPLRRHSSHVSKKHRVHTLFAHANIEGAISWCGVNFRPRPLSHTQFSRPSLLCRTLSGVFKRRSQLSDVSGARVDHGLNCKLNF